MKAIHIRSIILVRYLFHGMKYKWIDERTLGRKGLNLVTKCFQCGAPTVKKRIVAENWWGEVLTLVENVPAMVCEHCGEQYFDSKVVKELDRMKDKPPKAKRYIQIPVYAMSNL